MEQPVDKSLLKKFLHNRCTPEEIERVRAFLLEPGSDELLHRIMEEEGAGDWNDEGSKNRVSDWKTMSWNSQVRQRILADDQGRKKVVPLHKTWFIRQVAIWTALLITMGGGYALYRSREQRPPAVIAMMENVTAAGKLIKLQLSDSTTVYLNASSSIRYPAVFQGGTRDVYISGEAYFDVAPDNRHPFLIHTDDLQVQVLGTSLDVRSYKDDKETAVTVATGKVEVVPAIKNTGAVILLPGNQLVINRQSGLVSRAKVDPEGIISWQAGIFVFNYETLENIVKRLQRWYGVSFTIKDHALGQRRYKLKEKNTDLNTVMSSLSSADSGFHYSIADKQVIIWQ